MKSILRPDELTAPVSLDVFAQPRHLRPFPRSGLRPRGRGPVNLQKAYAPPMRDEPVIDMRLTHLMALDASLSDVRSALMRAARIRSGFSAEVRALLAQVDDLDRRVMAEVIR